MESMVGLKGRKVLVTGGTGFIGSHLVEKLDKLGANIIALDIEVNKKSYFIKEGIQKKSKLELVDIRDRSELSRVFEEHLPQYVFHLAAEAIVENSYENPIGAFETNIMGTVNVLEIARKTRSTQRIIVASSDKAYGKTKEAYIESSPLQGDHPYDVSKSSADLISTAYFKTYGLPIVITRFGNVYGEGDSHLNRIIPGICEALIKNKTLEIRSNGKYVRDYLYVEDVVRGYILLVLEKKILGEAFNFSSKDTLSVLEIISKVQKVVGKKIKFIIKNSAKNEIPYQHLNDSKIKKLGWKNEYDLEKALPAVLEWYRKNL